MPCRIGRKSICWFQPYPGPKSAAWARCCSPSRPRWRTARTVRGGSRQQGRGPWWRGDHFFCWVIHGNYWCVIYVYCCSSYIYIYTFIVHGILWCKSLLLFVFVPDFLHVPCFFSDVWWVNPHVWWSSYPCLMVSSSHVWRWEPFFDWND